MTNKVQSNKLTPPSRETPQPDRRSPAESVAFGVFHSLQGHAGSFLRRILPLIREIDEGVEEREDFAPTTPSSKVDRILSEVPNLPFSMERTSDEIAIIDEALRDLEPVATTPQLPRIEKPTALSVRTSRTRRPVVQSDVPELPSRTLSKALGAWFLMVLFIPLMALVIDRTLSLDLDPKTFDPSKNLLDWFTHVTGLYTRG